MWAYELGLSGQPASWNQQQNYSSGMFQPSSSSTGLGGWGAVAGAGVNALGGYFQAQAAGKQAEDRSKMSLAAQKELANIQRQQQQQDSDYRSGSAGRWSKYFGG